MVIDGLKPTREVASENKLERITPLSCNMNIFVRHDAQDKWDSSLCLKLENLHSTIGI